MRNLLGFLKKRYSPLDEKLVDPDPFEIFRKWFIEAVEARVNKPEAMAVATATPDGKPSVRMVLLKEILAKGFCFFTNYDSGKAREIDLNHFVSLLFHWPELDRQIRIEGYAVKTTGEISDKYFDQRPLESRISAIISPQSQTVPGREYLDNLWKKKEMELKGRKISRPPYWGGYHVIPDKIEFWQSADKRLHDRILYYKEQGQWKITRLAP